MVFMEAQWQEGDWISLYTSLTLKERACDDCRMVVEGELHLGDSDAKPLGSVPQSAGKLT
jgi:hypothetical protein